MIQKWYKNVAKSWSKNALIFWIWYRHRFVSCSVSSHVRHVMRFHMFSAVKQRCTLHFLHINFGVSVTQHRLSSLFVTYYLPVWGIFQDILEKYSSHNGFLNRQNKNKNLLTKGFIHVYFMHGSVHVILKRLLSK